MIADAILKKYSNRYSVSSIKEKRGIKLREDINNYIKACRENHRSYGFIEDELTRVGHSEKIIKSHISSYKKKTLRKKTITTTIAFALIFVTVLNLIISSNVNANGEVCTNSVDEMKLFSEEVNAYQLNHNLDKETIKVKLESSDENYFTEAIRNEDSSNCLLIEDAETRTSCVNYIENLEIKIIK